MLGCEANTWVLSTLDAMEENQPYSERYMAATVLVKSQRLLLFAKIVFKRHNNLYFGLVTPFSA
jgi:hypothetical protein